jgi:zinc-ribbon domain
MFCQHCGNQISENSAFCSACGTPIQTASGMPIPAASPFSIPIRRIQTLAYAWIVFAALNAFFSLIAFLIAHTLPGFHMNDGFGLPFGHHLAALLIRITWIIVGVRLALAVLAGYGLLNRARWGRTAGIIAGVVMLFHPILGTVMGIWSLVVLLNRENTAAWNTLT